MLKSTGWSLMPRAGGVIEFAELARSLDAPH